MDSYLNRLMSSQVTLFLEETKDAEELVDENHSQPCLCNRVGFCPAHGTYQPYIAMEGLHAITPHRLHISSQRITRKRLED